MLNDQAKAWKCEFCGSILGYLDGVDILRIKYKDLYFFVNNLSGVTQVRCLCRKCGKVNETKVKVMKLNKTTVLELEKYL